MGAIVAADIQTRFIPLERWHEAGHFYPGDVREWRHLLRNREYNGLNGAVLKVGRRLLIDEAKFLAWVASHAEAPAGR